MVVPERVLCRSLKNSLFLRDIHCQVAQFVCIQRSRGERREVVKAKLGRLVGTSEIQRGGESGMGQSLHQTIHQIIDLVASAKFIVMFMISNWVRMHNLRARMSISSEQQVLRGPVEDNLCSRGPCSLVRLLPRSVGVTWLMSMSTARVTPRAPDHTPST